jgi:hypothetical protein
MDPITIGAIIAGTGALANAVSGSSARKKEAEATQRMNAEEQRRHDELMEELYGTPSERKINSARTRLNIGKSDRIKQTLLSDAFKRTQRKMKEEAELDRIRKSAMLRQQADLQEAADKNKYLYKNLIPTEEKISAEDRHRASLDKMLTNQFRKYAERG